MGSASGAHCLGPDPAEPDASHGQAVAADFGVSYL
jgi:hypothetical protein